MKLNEALDILQNHKGSHTCDCFVPSLGRSVAFRPLTVAELKSIAKMSIDKEDLSIALNAMLLTLAMEELTLSDLTEIDKARILLELRQANQLGEDNYKLKCDKCKTEFNYELDIDEVIKKLNDVPKPKTIERQIKDTKLKIIIDLPSLELNTKYNTFIKILSDTVKSQNEYSEIQIEEVELLLLKYSSLLFIKQVFINDEEVEEFANCSFEERNTFIDMFPASIMTELTNTIVDDPRYNIMTSLSINITCPGCKAEKPLYINVADFFQI